MRWLEKLSRKRSRRTGTADWLTHAVPFFRNLGFFNEHRDEPDTRLVEMLQSKHREEWGDDFNPDDSLADLLLVRWDTELVWWEDTEADVCDENQVYVETLQQWAHISRGAFQPTEVMEQWHSDTGPIEVSFVLDGERVCIEPEFCDDWLDMTVLININELIEATGIQLEMYEAFDQTAFVVALRGDEKRRLIKERGWKFAT